MARAAFRVALCLNACCVMAATGTDEAACSDGDESCAADETTLLSLRIKQHETKDDTVSQCCYSVCGQCNPPDHVSCNTAGVCEAAQGSEGGGCSGRWLACPAESMLLDVRKDTQHEQKLLEVRKDLEQHEQTKSGCQEQDHKQSGHPGWQREGSCQLINNWQGCCAQCTGSCLGWTLVYDAPGACAKCYLKYGHLAPISDWKYDDNVISGLNSPTPVSPWSCCKWGPDCGDCGADGTGWCHESPANCATCGGRFDSRNSPPPVCK